MWMNLNGFNGSKSKGLTISSQLVKYGYNPATAKHFNFQVKNHGKSQFDLMPQISNYRNRVAN